MIAITGGDSKLIYLDLQLLAANEARAPPKE